MWKTCKIESHGFSQPVLQSEYILQNNLRFLVWNFPRFSSVSIKLVEDLKIASFYGKFFKSHSLLKLL